MLFLKNNKINIQTTKPILILKLQDSQCSASLPNPENSRVLLHKVNFKNNKTNYCEKYLLNSSFFTFQPASPWYTLHMKYNSAENIHSKATVAVYPQDSGLKYCKLPGTQQGSSHLLI